MAVSLALPCVSTVCAADDHMAGDSMFTKLVPDDALAAQRGKAVLTIMTLDGSVQDNAAINNLTGQNIITNGAFTNASGVATTIQNSGNNVLIQNATILQLDVR
jgi:hypothetical protein